MQQISDGPELHSMQTTPPELAAGASQTRNQPGLPLSLNESGAESWDPKRVSRAILDIISDYSLNKFDASKEWMEDGADRFLGVIERFVSAGTQVEACLPAFPFKSANKVYKVLGVLPDKADELALHRLHHICVRIQEIYPPGARVTVVSDGITYNDLLAISDKATWAYGEALRKLSADKKFTNVRFSRIKDLLDINIPHELNEVGYVANCTNFRRLLLNKFGNDDLDIDNEIATNSDAKMTYLGYRKFLESDLKYIYSQESKGGNRSYKRDCRYIAKEMLKRGYAFAKAINTAFPDYLRLSIHESISGIKIPVSLLDTKTGFTTPWHCSVALLANGQWLSAPMGEFAKDERLELIYEDGRPSYFKETTPPEGSDVPAISEGTSSYLQEYQPRSANGYLSGSSTPGTITSARNLQLNPFDTHDENLTVSSRSSMASQPLTKDISDNPSYQNEKTKTNEQELKAPFREVPNDIRYGKRLLPQIMDSLASREPERIVFSLAARRNNILNYKHISAKEFINAVDRVAWWLQEKVGKPQSIQPIGYIGPHDLRHILLTYASAKVGYAALFLSPKNNTDAALAVLEATECKIWATARDSTPISMVQDVLDKRSMTVLQLPPLIELLDSSSVESYAYTRAFEEASDEPFCFLHTSGTTGVPKPIPWSHALIGTMDAIRLLPSIKGEHDEDLVPWTSDWRSGDTIYSSFPMSHGAGVIMDILMPALFELRCVLGPVGILPNMGLVASLAESANIDIWSMVPSLVDELGETPKVLEKVGRSKFICASGGPVNEISSGKVNEKIRVLNLTGTTEGLFIGNLVTPREDWYWFCFHPRSGFEFKEIDPDSFEHWVHRNEHADLFQGIFHTFPEKHSINFKDLYKRHPKKKNYWAFKGRSDDLVVLSNGYKITPLDTESRVSTHPAIKGCLVFGTGRPQAGLLIDLLEGTEKTGDLLDSIWEIVKKANAESRHKNQLLRDFVTFSVPHQPFIYTDKGTVKRAATLSLYADYIDRFYDSRMEDDGRNTFDIDLNSSKSVQDCLKSIMLATLSETRELRVDANLFEIGLDSLGVFSVLKSIRIATGLGDSLAPHHLYNNPTIIEFSAVIQSVAVEVEQAKRDAGTDDTFSDDARFLKKAIADERSRQNFSLNAFDYVNPNHGMGLVLYFPVKDGVSNEDVFANLQTGLNRTFDMIPALGGKVTRRSEQDFGYKEGDLCVIVPPSSMAKSVHNRLVYKDLSETLPSFEELRATGFSPSAFKDQDVLRDDPFPEYPLDIFSGQVSFVRGGCLIAVDLNHTCLDGMGAMIALKAWGENCRYLQGDRSAILDWFHPESFNHSLPEIIHSQNKWTRPLEQIDHSIWNFLPFFPPSHERQPLWPLHSVWPLPKAQRTLKTTLFLISAEKLESLKRDVTDETQGDTLPISISDIVQAFFWMVVVRARYRVATEIHKQEFDPDASAVLELPTDGRPYFASLPATYMGSLLLLNRSVMPLAEICAKQTTVSSVANNLRQSAMRFNPQLVQDAFTILQSLPDHKRFSTANMGLNHMNNMISNMMLFPMQEISFGDTFFGNSGCAESMRPQLERGNGRFRFLVIFPMRPDGGLELALGTHEEELDVLQADEQFMRYAELVGVDKRD